jgi:hypothetical protein
MNSLEQLISWMKQIDPELHHWGKDASNCRGMRYDADFVNQRRILTGREAANIYQALEEHEELVLYAVPMEFDSFERVSLHDGKQYVPATESFDKGYRVHFKGKDVLLTVSETQFPHSLGTNYKELFQNFLKSDANIERARTYDMKDISVFAGGKI